MESTFTVKATGFSVEAALGVAARGREEPGLRPDFLVVILEIPFSAPVYAHLLSYVSNPWLKSSTIIPMAHFKFMLDRGVNHLIDCFPPKRVVSTESLGLPANLPDDQVVAFASQHGHLLIAANRRDFVRDTANYVAQSSKKPSGCCRVPGMILLVPNDEMTQRRILKGLDSRLLLDGRRITFSDVHDEDLLVTVEATGAARVSRLPRCAHCNYDATE